MTSETTTRSARAPMRVDNVAGVEPAAFARLDHREVDAPAARVLAQDDVERIELAARGDDARRGVQRVQHRAQPLPCAGLGHDRVGARQPSSAARRVRCAASPHPTHPMRRRARRTSARDPRERRPRWRRADGRASGSQGRRARHRRACAARTAARRAARQRSPSARRDRRRESRRRCVRRWRPVRSSAGHSSPRVR